MLLNDNYLGELRGAVEQRTSYEDAAMQILLQDALDASDVIGRWEYDVPNDRAYADALVARVFNLDPIAAKSGAPLKAFLAGIHPNDRERAAQTIARSAEDGLVCTLEYRVRSADGVTRRVLDRGRFAHDRAGRPTRGSGILVDITQTKPDTVSGLSASDLRTSDLRPSNLRGSLERAAEHGLVVRAAIHELPPSVLHQMSDMLLLEIGRRLAQITDVRHQGG